MREVIAAVAERFRGVGKGDRLGVVAFEPQKKGTETPGLAQLTFNNFITDGKERIDSLFEA